MKHRAGIFSAPLFFTIVQKSIAKPMNVGSDMKKPCRIDRKGFAFDTDLKDVLVTTSLALGDDGRLYLCPLPHIVMLMMQL